LKLEITHHKKIVSTRGAAKHRHPSETGDAARAAPSYVQQQTPKENAPGCEVCVGRRAATEKINKWMMQRWGEKLILSNQQCL
jgi:hypothetical protein